MQEPQDTLVRDMVSTLNPNLQEAFQERAAIMEHEGGLERRLAEAHALLDVMRRNPKTPAEIVILRIQWKGTTSWLMSTDLSFARAHLAPLKDLEISIVTEIESDLTQIA